MINLFDKNDQTTRDLMTSLDQAGFAHQTVFLADDGWLPLGSESPYMYFTGRTNQGRARYFNELTLPKYWEIHGSNSEASISFYGVTKAKINYALPIERRLIKSVDWLDPSGKLHFTDHYDRAGVRFAQTVYDKAQTPIVRTYFDEAQNEVIVENFVTKDILLTQAGKTLNFKNLVDFTLYYLAQRKFDLQQIFINSLGTPLLVSARLPQTGADVVFWQEELTDNIPGNMQFILDGELPRVKKIVMQDEKTYARAKELVPETEMFANLGFIYAKKRANHHQKTALILTNSDQLEQFITLVDELPDFEFKIAAVTEMSQHLMNLGQADNIELYPNVSQKELADLWQSADFYLDINHQNELQNAVRQAYENDMLILSFENTLHDPNFVAKENVYRPSEAKAMAAKLRRAASERKYLAELLAKQAKQAKEATVAQYQEILGQVK